MESDRFNSKGWVVHPPFHLMGRGEERRGEELLGWVGVNLNALALVLLGGQ